MNRHEFVAAEGLRGELNEALKLPIVQLAIDIVSKEGTAKALPKAVPGVSYSEQLAAVGAQSIGWAGALTALTSLINNPMLTRATNLSQNNMYIAEARKRMMESEHYTEEEIDGIVAKQ